MAEALAQSGAAVCIWGTNADKNAAALAKLKAHGAKALALHCDVGDEQGVEKRFAETAMTEKALNWDKFRDKVLPRVPMRRWGKPEDFGAIAVYLVSDASSYHTGDTFLIDGGYSLF